MKIGRVYAADLDDWDLPEKTFSWTTDPKDHHFHLDPDSGTLSMVGDTPEGNYTLRVTARDMRRGETAECDVTVRVRSLSLRAVENSQVVTFAGVNDVDFVKVSSRDQMK